MVVGHRGVAEHLVLPVGGFAVVVIVQRLIAAESLIIAEVGFVHLVGSEHFGLQLNKFTTLQQFQSLRTPLVTDGAFIGDARCGFRAAFGGDYDYTVGAAGAVDGRCRSVLQNVD